MELILNQFVKKTSSTRRQSISKLGAKRLIKRSVDLGVGKKSRHSLGKAIVRGARPVAKFIYGAAKGLGKLATLILIGRL